MNYDNEAYLYSKHTEMFNPKGAKVRVIPDYNQLNLYQPVQHYTPSETVAYSFMDAAKSADVSMDIDDIFKTKIGHSEDRIDLILGQLKERDRLKYDNLQRIYDDLFRVDQFRAEIPHPQNYLKDNTWSGLNDSELKLREQIRRELTSSSQDMAFLSNDLRNSLLEFKLQNSKQAMFEDSDVGGTLDKLLIAPDGALQTRQGETYDPPDNKYKSPT
jgi:hypothetical protein